MSPAQGVIGGQFKPLSAEDIDRIHKATLEVFDEVGFQCHSRRALEIFDQGGARVDFDNKHVRVPPSIVEKCIASAPSRIVMAGREEKNDLILEGSQVYFGTGTVARDILDLETGELRPSTLEDIARLARLADNLDNTSFLTVPCTPHELPVDAWDQNGIYVSLANSTKHVSAAVWHPEGCRQAIELAAIVAGGYEALREKPLISIIVGVFSPLTMDEVNTDIQLIAIEYGVPLIPPTAPICGATAPITLAGGILLANIEALEGIILSQLARPGAPVLYGDAISVADPMNLNAVPGAPEMGLVNAGGAQMAQHYSIPIYSTAGMTDAKIPDAQSGYEKALSSLAVALSGANYIHDAVGLLGFGTVASYEQYVIDDEINGMIRRMVRGIEVNDDTLALDLIKNVGSNGVFCNQRHTVNHLRTELFFPRVSDRLTRDEWKARGAKDTRERARDIVRETLKHHQPTPLPEDVDKQIRESIPNIV